VEKRRRFNVAGRLPVRMGLNRGAILVLLCLRSDEVAWTCGDLSASVLQGYVQRVPALLRRPLRWPQSPDPGLKAGGGDPQFPVDVDEQGRLTCRCARAPPGESREAAG